MIENLGPHLQQALGQPPANPSPSPSHQNLLAIHLWKGKRLLTESFLRVKAGKL